jgi:hypothetical protein
MLSKLEEIAAFCGVEATAHFLAGFRLSQHSMQ